MIKVFIKKIIIFGVLLLIILFFVNWLYVKFVLPEKNSYKTVQQYNFYKDDTKILVFGSSMPRAAVKTDIIPNSFNFADDAGSYEATYFKLRKAAETDQLNIKLIILPIDLHEFSISETYETWKWSGYLGVSLRELSGITHKNHIRLWIEKNFPVIGNGLELQRLFFKSESTEIIRGWVKRETKFSNFENRTATVEDMFQRHFREGYNSNIERITYYFKKTLDLAYEKNITTVLIKYPLTREYLDYASSNINVQEYYNKIEDLLLEYNNVCVLDYQNIFADLPELFRDANHLNIHGAEIFTGMLMEDLEKTKCSLNN